MNTSPSLVVFIGHNASRSGAPALLLEIIQSFKAQTKIPFIILLKKGGELQSAYEQAGQTYIWESTKKPALNKIKRNARKIIDRFADIKRKRIIRSICYKASVILSNTITNGSLVEEVNKKNCPVITYVHELQYAIQEATDRTGLDCALKQTSLFLAGSKAVKDNLCLQYHIADSKIEVIYSSLAVQVRERSEYARQTNMLRSEYGISEGSLLIGVAAGTEWRKGIDLFLPLVVAYRKLYGLNQLHFLWMGTKKGSVMENQLIFDCQKLGLEGQVHLRAHGSDYLSTMASFDIHLLLSREDPYPLVVLDAATFGIPTTCFENAGGAPEFVEKDAGFIIPYLDINEMAVKLHQLVSHPMKRLEVGQAARQKVLLRHNLFTATQKIVTHINALL